MSNECHVYVIAVDNEDGSGPVKVGISANPYSRLKELQTASPYKLAMVHSFLTPNRDIAFDIERCFHETQAEHRASGEWFNFNPIDALMLMCICIQVLLEVRSGLDEEDTELALRKMGVRDGQEKLVKWGVSHDAAYTHH